MSILVPMDIAKIIKSIGKNEFSRKELLGIGLTSKQIKSLLSNGKLKRIFRGKYCAITSETEEITHDQRFREATLQVGSKSAVCLLSALEYYNLTDLITNSVWIMVPQEKRCTSKNLTLLRRTKPQWSIGIKRHRGFRITSIERTLVDCLIYHDKVSKIETISAIKKALKRKKTNLTKIYNMAIELGVAARFQDIFEVLM